MEFEEFKKKFENTKEKFSYSDSILFCSHGMFYSDGGILQASFLVSQHKDGKYQITTLIEGGSIAKYNTLEEAYEALKEICKLNNVEME